MQFLMTCCCSERIRKCIHYVLNPKAGSTFLTSSLGLPHFLASSGSGQSCWQCASVPTLQSARPNHSVDWPHRDEIVFTVVRDPIATALAAYIELQRRPLLDSKMVAWKGFDQRKLKYWPPRYIAMPCNDKLQRLQRFEAYVDTVAQGFPIGREGHHIWPQALKVDHVTRTSPPSYDAIIHIEHLSEGMAFLASLANISANSSFETSSRYQHSTQLGSAWASQRSKRQRNSTHDFLWKGDGHFSGCSDIDLQGNERLLRKLCKLYEADFVCFGYGLPAACREQ